MDQSLENRIRERAYEIWAAHGYVHGQADQHWLAAEREILRHRRSRSSANPPRKRSDGRLHDRRPPRPSQWPANLAHHTRKYVGANTVGPWVA